MTYKKYGRRFAFKGKGGGPDSEEAIAISIHHVSQVAVAYHDQFFSLTAASDTATFHQQQEGISIVKISQISY